MIENYEEYLRIMVILISEFKPKKNKQDSSTNRYSSSSFDKIQYRLAEELPC